MTRTRRPPPTTRRTNDLPTDGGRAVDSFLAKVAAAPKTGGSGRRGRLLFAMDATMSRQPTWDRACQIQGDMFLETAAIGGLSVQLAFFRGHSELKASRWVDQSEALLRLMSSVSCRGGYTQIGRMLGHALKETRRDKIGAIVYVGDCCEEPPDHLCHLAGELGLMNTPLFMFHEGGDPTAGLAFREMARLSGGAYVPFDASSPAQLRDLLRAAAVYAAGGRAVLEDHSAGRGDAGVKLLAQLR